MNHILKFTIINISHSNIVNSFLPTPPLHQMQGLTPRPNARQSNHNTMEPNALGDYVTHAAAVRST